MMPAVRAQGKCGNCWSHAATGALEAHAFLNTWNRTTLSLQQILDCTYPEKPYCDGGQRYEGMERNAIQFTLKSYPDNQKPETKGPCKSNENDPYLVVGGKILPKVERLRWPDELAIQIALVEKGPVVVYYTASDGFKKEVRQNAETVFRGAGDCKGKRINHAVLVVGYGVERQSGGEDVKYWKVMNSWGTEWGNEGFFLIERGVNLCKIESFMMYPIVPDNPGKDNFSFTPTTLHWRISQSFCPFYFFKDAIL